MMFGGVPMSVTRPPNSDPNDSGMSNSAGDRSDCRAVWITTGNRSAKAPTLFMKADRMPTRTTTAPV